MVGGLIASSNSWFNQKLGAQGNVLCKFALCDVMVAILFACQSYMNVRQRQFFERDTDLSYYIKGKPNFDTVTPGACIGMGIGISFSICCIYSFFIIETKASTGKTAETGMYRWQHFLLYVLAVVFVALASSTAVDILKITVARPRPSFFYICNYQGYRDGVDSNNLTSYNTLTTTGAVGDYGKCLDGLLNDSIKSFPSGHSSLISCTMLFTSLVIRKMFKIDTSVSIAGIASWLPLVLAAYVCVTRIQDFKHREDDVSIGAIIGFIVCAITWHSLEWSVDNLNLIHTKMSSSSDDDNKAPSSSV